ncbi:MAG TPA: hypothetical protein VLS89_13455, partial [Candidatus Nanopelagicales bacterium]|nr:hypothetical protein [Candidatus Nanopelagicales bacterium]
SRAEFKKRPGLLALLNAAEARAFDVVVTRDETRLGGDTYRTGIVIQDLLDHGARLFYYFTGEEVRLDGAVAPSRSSSWPRAPSPPSSSARRPPSAPTST